jgi:2-polyprenyl-3-methyl-5-hydroxy-6-metoxy-1,4-benzoquinol methylase
MSFDFQAAYDELNPADDDYRFYAALAAAAGASRAVDLGCGTGTLARMLASGGASVTGIDPDPEMLRVAKLRAVGVGPAGGRGVAGAPGPACRPRRRDS